MKSLLLATALSTCCAIPATAASFEELTPYLSGQRFTWEEHGRGRRILKESGELFSGGVVVGAKTDFSMTFRGKAEIFGGEVDYRGETQEPDPVPVTTEVTYFGVKSQFDLGYRFPLASLQVEPFGGVGYRCWVRDLQDGTSSSGEHVSGYSELWQTGYGRLGARGRYQAPGGVSLFVEGGALYPFYTGNSIDFSDSGTTTFHPEGKASGFAEAGAVWRRLKLTLYYEGFRWSRSPVKGVDGDYFYQPSSSSDIFGLNLGWTFR